MMLRRGARAGFTLTEILVSLAILVLVTGALLSAFPAASRTLERGRGRDVAADAANRELEYWRTVGYVTIHAHLGNARSKEFPAAYDLPASLAGAAAKIVLTRASADFSDTAGNPGEETGRVRARVTISWRSGGGRPEAISMTTVVADDVLEESANDEGGMGYDDDVDDPDTDDDHDADDTDGEEDDEDLDKGIPFPPALPDR